MCDCHTLRSWVEIANPIYVEHNLFLCSGKNVFKKPVKLTIAVVPTQTNQATLSQATPTVAPDIVGGDVIVFDGKTFTVTFSQISGIIISLFLLCM